MPIALSRAAERSAWWATSRRRLCSAGLAAMRCSESVGVSSTEGRVPVVVDRSAKWLPVILLGSIVPVGWCQLHGMGRRI